MFHFAIFATLCFFDSKEFEQKITKITKGFLDVGAAVNSRRNNAVAGEDTRHYIVAR